MHPATLRTLLLGMAMVLATTGSAVAQSSGVADDVVSVAGPGAPAAERMAAMAALAPATTAVITTAATFPDALASGLLQDDAMLLGAVEGRLSPAGRALLEDAGVTDVVILGGTAAVGEQIRQDLPAGATVTRLSGAERTATAAAVAASRGTADVVLLARARGPEDTPSAGFIDAIGAGVWSAVTGWPVLLVDGTTVSEATRQAVRTVDPHRVVVIGGTAAVTDAVASEVADGRPVQRVSGPERFTTAARVAAEVRPDGAGADLVVLVDGTDPQAWTSGFAAAHLAVIEEGAVLLTSGGDVPDATAQALQELAPARIVCAARPVACATARTAAGLPPVTDVVVTPPSEQPLEAGQQVQLTSDGAVTVVDDGGCLQNGRRVGDLATDCTITVRAQATDDTVGQTLTLTWPALAVDAVELAAPAEYTSPDAGGRMDFDQTVDTRPEADRQASSGAFVDVAGSVLRYPDGGAVPVLWAGYGGAARIAPDGLAVPLDSSTFRLLRARVFSPGGGQLGVEWRSCPTAVGTNCIEPSQIVRRGSASAALSAGWQTVTLDLDATAGWADGPVHTLYVSAPAGAAIDDLRVTDTSTPASLDVATAEGVQVVWDRNADPSDNTDATSSGWGILPGGRVDTAELPPGRYWLHATTRGPVDVGATAGPLTITTPSPVSSDRPDPAEYARDVRGDAWDMGPGDVATVGNATRVEGPGFTGVNANAGGDPFVVLDVPTPIDPGVFTHLTVTFTVDGPFSLGFGPGGGTLGRLLFQQGSQTWRDSNDIVAYPGQASYTLDLTGVAALEPGTPAWQSAPVTAVRFDPNEDPASGRRWTITSIALTAGPP